MTIETLLDSVRFVFEKSYRVSLGVGTAIHLAFQTTQYCMGNNYFVNKYEQFQEHPMLTTLEILVPYVVAYGVSFGSRRLGD